MRAQKLIIADIGVTISVVMNGMSGFTVAGSKTMWNSHRECKKLIISITVPDQNRVRHHKRKYIARGEALKTVASDEDKQDQLQSICHKRHIEWPNP